MGVLRTAEGLLLKLKTIILIIVIPDIVNRESILVWFRMDPRRLPAGMTEVSRHSRGNGNPGSCFIRMDPRLKPRVWRRQDGSPYSWSIRLLNKGSWVHRFLLSYPQREIICMNSWCEFWYIIRSSMNHGDAKSRLPLTTKAGLRVESQTTLIR